MTDADRVRAAPPPATPARLAPANPARLRSGHPHVVCRRCGAVADTGAAGHVHPPQAPSLAGFAVEEAQVTFWGLCPRCQQAAPPPG